jgi:hypothetical protein
MLELAILFSFKSYAIAMGFQYGGKVEAKAQAALSKASQAAVDTSKKA